MLGPLDIIGGDITHLRELANIPVRLKFSEVSDSLNRVSEFSEAVYRRGVSHVLDVIAHTTNQDQNPMGSNDVNVNYQAVRDFVSALVESAGEKLCIGTLNYDGLLFSALPDSLSRADLVEGFEESLVWRSVVASQEVLRGRKLRQMDNLENFDISLLHLHGSLGWLKSESEFIIFNIPDLRQVGYWEQWRDGASEWLPVVVLTNQLSKSKGCLVTG